jgi:hypothetical protein
MGGHSSSILTDVSRPKARDADNTEPRFLWRDADSGQIFGRSNSHYFAKTKAAHYAALPILQRARNMEVFRLNVDAVDDDDGEVIARYEAATEEATSNS